MTKDLTNNGAATNVAIPDDFEQKLMSGIAQSRAATMISGGNPYLTLAKSGKWQFGPAKELVEPGSQWVVNLATLAHGYVCWDEGEKLGTVMKPMWEPKPPKPAAIEGVPFAEQRAFDLRCRSGTDAGTQVTYNISSIGGMRAVDGLLSQIQKRLAEAPDRAYPVLELGADSYQHKKHGEIFTPILSLVGWADVNGDMGDGRPVLETKAQAEEADEPAAAPVRRRRQPTEAPAAAQPLRSTTQAQAEQRRRPGAR